MIEVDVSFKLDFSFEFAKKLAINLPPN